MRRLENNEDSLVLQSSTCTTIKAPNMLSKVVSGEDGIQPQKSWQNWNIQMVCGENVNS